MPDPFIFESGESVAVGATVENDYVYATGDLVSDSGQSAFAFISGRGLGGAEWYDGFEEWDLSPYEVWTRAGDSDAWKFTESNAIAGSVSVQGTNMTGGTVDDRQEHLRLTEVSFPDTVEISALFRVRHNMGDASLRLYEDGRDGLYAFRYNPAGTDNPTIRIDGPEGTAAEDDPTIPYNVTCRATARRESDGTTTFTVSEVGGDREDTLTATTADSPADPVYVGLHSYRGSIFDEFTARSL